jgi:hypothetical protein
MKKIEIIRQDLGYSVQTCNPVGEMRRWFRDTVYDQLGSTVANARWAESWTGGCNLQQGNSATGCNGVMIGDDEWSRWNFTCTGGERSVVHWRSDRQRLGLGLPAEVPTMGLPRAAPSAH